jgi:predicted HicB family RNase H-like nuclease
VKFNLRLPGDLKTRLHLEALKNGRSLNAEIVHRLMRSLDAGRYRP